MMIEAYTDTTDETYLEGQDRAKVNIRAEFSPHDPELVVEVRDGFFEVHMRSKNLDGTYRDREIIAGSLHGCWIYADDGHSQVYV